MAALTPLPRWATLGLHVQGFPSRPPPLPSRWRTGRDLIHIERRSNLDRTTHAPRHEPAGFFVSMDFSKLDGLIPAVIQDADSSEVLMVGFMNEQALADTRRTGYATFFSRTRNRLWMKGETSGNKLQ